MDDTNVVEGVAEDVAENVDLSVVGEVSGEEVECKYKDIRDKILALLLETENKTWDLAVVLETAYEADMYREWNYDSFREYVEKELNIQIRKAQYLVQLQEWFKKMPANIQQWMRGIGWTKARMLMHAVTAENAAEWKNKVAGKTVAEIGAMLKDAKDVTSGADGGEDGGGSKEDKPASKNFKLFPEQLKNVDMALEKAMEMSGSDKPGNLLDMICIEFLSTNAGIDSVQSYLRFMEKNLGVCIVAYLLEENKIVYGEDFIRALEAKQEQENIEDDGNEDDEDDDGTEESSSDSEAYN